MASVWPFRHLGLKLASVGLAVLLWLAIAGNPIEERGLQVPIEMRQFPAELELGGRVPSAIDVRVRGAAGQLRRLATGDVVVVLDLHDASAGEHLMHLSPANVSAPIGVDIVQIIPNTLAMTFVRRGAKP